MAKVQVVTKSADIDGKPVNWNVLAITSWLEGDFQTLELKLNKTEAMLAKMLLSSTQSAPNVETRKATEDEAPTVTKTEAEPKAENWLHD